MHGCGASHWRMALWSYYRWSMHSQSDSPSQSSYILWLMCVISSAIWSSHVVMEGNQKTSQLLVILELVGESVNLKEG